MSASDRILLVEDDPDHAVLASRSLEAAPDTGVVTVTENIAAARTWLATHTPDIVVSDLHLPDGSAMDLLGLPFPLVVMTSQGDEQQAVQAMKRGALDYVVKSPAMFRDLPMIIARALRAARADRDRLRAEASLRESEERFRQLADSIEDAFWLYDLAEARMVYASPAWWRVYEGADNDTATGEAAPTPDQAGGSARNDDTGSAATRALPQHPAFRPVSIHADDRAAVVAAFTRDAPATAVTREYRLVKGRQTRWIAERTFPLPDAAGQPWRIAGLGSDATERRQLEAALRQSQKMEAVGQLAGGVAHDLNNMLTVILASVDQIARELTTDDQKELCQTVVGAAERSAELTRRLLAFSRKGNARSAPLDVHVVLRDTIKLLERSIDRRVEIVAELGAESAVVIGDASQLQAALLNLGLNARDAMPNGGRLTVTTQLRELDAAACMSIPFDVKAGPYLRISIRDEGVGITSENLTRVFEPFFTTKPVGQGTGLGLAAVYGTAIEHGGAVTVYSELGRGTVFHLYLPSSGRAAVSVAPAPSPKAGTGLVLIVDDEPLILRTTSQLLKMIGYQVVTAKDGADGVRVFSQNHPRLVAVLCDLIMPVLSGADCTRQMRALDPAVPIIMCSGYPRDDRRGGIGLGEDFDAFLPKPYRLEEIAGLLSRTARKL